jgi:hypothetical protein
MVSPVLPPNLTFLAQWLNDLEARIEAMENPNAPKPVFACTTALMPDAATYIGCVLRNTTLNILAHSDGTNWRRQDTGAVI